MVGSKVSSVGGFVPSGSLVSMVGSKVSSVGGLNSLQVLERAKWFFINSNELIMIAQAGMIFTNRGTVPVKSTVAPRLAYNFRMLAQVDGEGVLHKFERADHDRTSRHDLHQPRHRSGEEHSRAA